MVARHASGCDWPRSLERLPERVHLPIQPPNVGFARQIVLSLGPASCTGRSGPVCKLGQTATYCVWWREVNTPIPAIQEESPCSPRIDHHEASRTSQIRWDAAHSTTTRQNRPAPQCFAETARRLKWSREDTDSIPATYIAHLQRWDSATLSVSAAEPASPAAASRLFLH